MSITIGFFNKNNKPAEIEYLTKMKRAYREVPFDNYTFVTDGNFALGHMAMNILTENPITKEPVLSDTGRYLGSGRIRIDNRDDLEKKGDRSI